MQSETILDELVDCKYCYRLSLDNLAAGYLHAPSRSSLVRSAQKCRLCSLLFRKDRSRHSSQLRLRLEAFSEDDPQLCLRVAHLNNNALVGHQLSFFLYTSPGKYLAGCRIEFLSTYEHTLGDPSVKYGITEKRTLSQTASQESFAIAARWINECVAEHDCSTHLSLKEQANMYPSRLIDVNAFADSSDVQLVDNDGGSKCYVTLSYCWGKSRTFTTTSRSLRLRKTRIHFESLPRTFMDAVRIVRKLEVRYLWIDALCIIQDDRLDWQRESAKMGAIYR